MQASFLNFRNPRTLVCLALVVFLHGVAVNCLQLQSRSVWFAERESAALPLPAISLRLLPMVLESAVVQVMPPSTRSSSSFGTGVNASERTSLQTPAPRALDLAPGPSHLTTEPSGESSSETAAAPLNLNLSKRDLSAAAASRLPRPLPTHMTPSAWQQFVKTLGPLDEIREERLSINRTRIHTKYGCYELEQTATKRIDPFSWSPQFVTNCRY